MLKNTYHWNYTASQMTKSRANYKEGEIITTLPQEVPSPRIILPRALHCFGIDLGLVLPQKCCLNLDR